jgi:muramidase (phage lysozyme)
MTPNESAFLAMIRRSEGTDKAPDPYACCYGYRFTITDFSDHPAVLGTWHGESLANLGPAYAGLVSTGAGAYQLIKPTWLAMKAQLNLPDFSPASQDAAAIGLIQGKGALPQVDAGQLETAIVLCRGIWASLPGGTSGQPQTQLGTLVQAYTANGGTLA